MPTVLQAVVSDTYGRKNGPMYSRPLVDTVSTTCIVGIQFYSTNLVCKMS